MVKMGSDYTTPINCRMRGIIVTEDNKHLFVEIGCAYSPDIIHTSLSQKEYVIKYPNPQYVSVGFCFRVDIPEDFYRNSSKEFSKYIRENFFEIPYTKEGIINLLQKFNKEIDDIELVDDYYIDEYCEKNVFFELYDNRLKHNNKIVEIRNIEPNINGEMHIKYQYTCYAVDGTKYSEIRETKDKIKNIIKQYGKDNVKPLVDKYVKELCDIFKNDKTKEKYNQLLKDMFINNKISIDLETSNMDEIEM